MHFSPSGWLTWRKFVEFIQSWLSFEPFLFSNVLKSLFKGFIWWLINDKHLIPFNNLHKYLGSTPADPPVQHWGSWCCLPTGILSTSPPRWARSQQPLRHTRVHPPFCIKAKTETKKPLCETVTGKMGPERRVTSQVLSESLGQAAKWGPLASRRKGFKTEP